LPSSQQASDAATNLSTTQPIAIEPDDQPRGSQPIDRDSHPATPARSTPRRETAPFAQAAAASPTSMARMQTTVKMRDRVDFMANLETNGHHERRN
jgi:hypothetical protein